MLYPFIKSVVLSRTGTITTRLTSRASSRST